MSGEPIRTVEHYNGLFDPNAYLGEYYQIGGSGEEKWDYILPALKFWSRTFSREDVGGEDLLELGTGPNLMATMYASRKYKNIYWSDYAEANRDALRAWINKEKSAWDWTQYFDYVAKEENLTGGAAEVEARVRSTVKDILTCNVLLDNPLHPLESKQFDAILSCGCFEAACKDRETYAKSVLSVSKLLKPGGWFFLDGDLLESFYMVGDEKFFVLNLDIDFIKSAFEAAGFTDIVVEVLSYDAKVRDAANKYDAEKFFHLTAKKL